LFNVNKLLFDRISENDYFFSLGGEWSYQELVDEVAKRVTHVEPWAAGTSRNASTAWCLLVKLCQYRLTTKQLQAMLRKTGQPYVRALGFLYLRLVTEPKALWDWMEAFVDDPEMFAPSSNPDATMPMGDFVQKILKDMHFYDTVLPRIPVPIERKMKALMILFEDEQKRATSNLRAMHLLAPGASVHAIYKDEDNDPAFYEATVVEVLPPAEEGRKPQVVVTFNEYGNTETVALGKVMLPEGSGNGGGGGDDRGERRRSRSRSRDRGDRRRSRSRDRDRDARGGGGGAAGAGGSLLDSVMGKVTERDRDRSAATGKDYAQRPGGI
jgi:pre-mRNA-splicing factor 38B